MKVASQVLARRAAAKAELEEWLSTVSGGARALTPAELAIYSKRHPVAGWRLAVDFGDRCRRLDILIDGRFPWAPPRIALLDRPRFLVWPHVEEDGALCLLSDTATIKVRRPSLVAAYLLAEACRLIEDSAAERNLSDFRTEFVSYWDWAKTKDTPIIFTAAEMEPPSRIICVWRGKGFFLVSDTEEAVLAWLGNRFGEKRADWSTERALFVWLEQLPLPTEYPSSGVAVRNLLRSTTGPALALLEELAAAGYDQILVLLAGPTQNGPCGAALVLRAPRAVRGKSTSDFLTRGFRPGRAPATIVSQRYMGAGSAERLSVNRVDPTWVHGRGREGRFAKLRHARVAVLGCGSLGAPVILDLARAGVGQMCLIDPDKLVAANTGRHPLGMPDVGRPKSEALAERIRANHPHIRVDAFPERWEEVVQRTPEVLQSCDLIVSAIGDWSSEGALNEWHIGSQRRPPIVYAWTEAHACAGHAVAIGEEGGCFACGCTEDGQPILRVTRWPAGSTLEQEPACGALYQPFGPVELSYIHALTAELALDCLITGVPRSAHRIWIARRPLIESLGGAWTDEFAAIAGAHECGGFIQELIWPAGPCAECENPL
jgi:molybdopterin/thiamine biosynthesis adenylyltransferase